MAYQYSVQVERISPSPLSSVVYSADGEGAWWIVVDEGTLADFLDPVTDANLLQTPVALERYDDRAAWQAAVEERLGSFTERNV